MRVFVKRYGDFATGIFFLLLSVFYFSQISTIEIIDSGSVDAAFIPKLVAGAMCLLSICQITASVIKLKKGAGREMQVREENGKQELAEAGAQASIEWKSTILTAVLLLIYVALFEKIGFVITTMVYLFLQLLILAPERKPKQIAVFAVSSVAAAFLLQYVFIHLLFVMLPEGILR